MSREEIILRGRDRAVRFPMTPASIDVSDGSRTASYDLIGQPVEIPDGALQTRYSWSGRLPGRARRNKAYVIKRNWEDPEEIKDRLRDWSHSRRPIKLVLAEARLTDDVFVSRFDWSHSGGHGDILYSIELTEWRDVEVRRGPKKKKKRKKRGRDRDRVEGSAMFTYNTRVGDTLHLVARSELGSATRYPEIIAVNLAWVGADPDQEFPPGTELVIPA